MHLCLCLQSGASAESWTCLSSALSRQRFGSPKAASLQSTRGLQRMQDLWGWRVLLPCLYTTTALLQEMEWGQTVARQTYLTYCWIISKTVTTTKKWQGLSQKDQISLHKNEYSATTNTALTFNVKFTLYSKIKLYTKTPYIQKWSTKCNCSPKAQIRTPKCNKMNQDGIDSYSWRMQSFSQNSTQRGNLALRNRCYLSFVCSYPADQLPAVYQLNIRGLAQLWYGVISLFGLWAASHMPLR